MATITITVTVEEIENGVQHNVLLAAGTKIPSRILIGRTARVWPNEENFVPGNRCVSTHGMTISG
jgi:hypothetical protein